MGAGYNADNQNASGAFTYDGEGNPTLYNGIGGQNFDAEDRPTHVQTPVSGEANGWRADGLRGWKQGAGGLVNYLYADGVPVCEFTGANVTAVNTWGPGGLLARHTNNIQAGTSANTYYAWDGLGNAAQTLDGSGNVTNTFAFDAYGKGVSTSATTDPYAGFGGQWGYYTDSETGMTLCGARFYDSNAGRWLTRDPIGYGGGINLYGFVRGNPITFVDPTGLDVGTGSMDTLNQWGDAYHSCSYILSPPSMKASADPLAQWLIRFWQGVQDLWGVYVTGTNYFIPRSWARPEKFADHYARHGRAVGATSEEEYAQMAQVHLARQDEPNMESITTPDGWKKV